MSCKGPTGVGRQPQKPPAASMTVRILSSPPDIPRTPNGYREPVEVPGAQRSAQARSGAARIHQEPSDAASSQEYQGVHRSGQEPSGLPWSPRSHACTGQESSSGAA